VLVVYNLAALYALWSKPDAALENLRRAVALDADKVRQWLSSDAMFDGLKGTPEFEAALAPGTPAPEPAPGGAAAE
jgi:hypothetical protein